MNEDHEFRIGEKVEFHPSEAFFSANCDVYISKYYPKVGTVGTVVGHSVKKHSFYIRPMARRYDNARRLLACKG